MVAAALNAQALLPRPPGGNGPGAALALVVHAALLLALTVSVDWRSRPADVVAAELWASVPQVAAPPPPPAPEPRPEPQPVPQPAPQPTPRAEPPPRAADADIAIERDRRKVEAERKKREEAERALAEEKKKRDEEAREAREAKAQERAQERRLAEQREANLRRIMGDAATAAANGRSTGSAAQDAAPSAAYAGRVAALIRRASVFTGSVPGNPAAEVEVRTGAGGTIIARRIVKSSGHKAWDDAVLQAIDKVGTLPRDSDGRVPAQLIVAFRPKDE